MFRISKSDDSVEHGDPVSEKAEREPSPQGSGNRVASSALRWLGGSYKREQPGDDVADAEAADRSDEDDLADDLELTSLLDDDDLDEEDEDDEGPASSQSDLAFAPASVEAQSGNVLFPDLYDDGDDFDDFDDLYEIKDITPPAAADEAATLPKISLDDISLPSPRDDAPASPAALDELEPGPAQSDDAAFPAELLEVVETFDTGEASETFEDGETFEASKTFDLVVPEPSAMPLDDPMRDDQATDQASSQPPQDEMLLDNLLQDEPLPEAVLSNEEFDSESLAGTLNASLALQPIPELQTGPRLASKTPSKRPSRRKDDWIEVLDDGSPGDNDADMHELVLSDEDDDDLDVAPSDITFPEITPFDIEELEIEPLDAYEQDQADDWHAHLADVLGATDEEPETSPEIPKTTPEVKQPPSRQDDPTSIVPLSKTLTQLAASSPPTVPTNPPKAASGPTVDAANPLEDGDDLMPSLPVVTARQKMAASEPSMLPVETIGISAEHLPLAIIANLPRLRRFAVAQIGDELEADRLAQTTMKAALADMSVLRSDCDLGIALMMLLYKRRREMLNDPSALKRTPETVRAFETLLCHGIAGADQFETHEFARAINGLEERDRELLILVALENLSYDQIADMTGLSAQQVMVRVSSARMRLRQALTAEAATDDGKSSAATLPHAQEIDINGYLDGELDGHHMAGIDALVEYDEDAADRLLHYGIQGDLIRRLYAPLINRPIPGTMLATLSATAKPTRWGFRFGPRKALIAGAAIIALTAATWPHIGPTLNGLVSDAMAVSSINVER